MFKKYKKITTLILVLLISQVGLIYMWLHNTNKTLLQTPIKQIITDKTEDSIISHDSYHMEKSFYDEAYRFGTNDIKISPNNVYGGIIPHHLFVKEKIAAWFMGLKNTDYKTVILIGPNHYEAGKSDIIISRAKWNTPYGEILPDLELSKKILSNKSITVEEDLFTNEHSISGLVPFIKNSLPKAKILPIIIKLNTSKEDLDFLANQLANNTDKEKTLILASVDFSHYQPSLVADFHDDLSKSVIENFDFNRIHNLEIDSPASIYTVLKYLENTGSQKSDLVFHTNSSSLLGTPEQVGTSHFLYYFAKGKANSQPAINMLFFGDLMLDRAVKNKIDNQGLKSVLENLAGDENRFFMGNDLVSANLEGSLTNNGQHYPPEASIDFAIDPKYLAELKNKYYFNFFNLANNHILDQGYKGMEETTQNLTKLGINFVGCSDASINQCSTTSLTIGDQKIGMAGFSMVYTPLNNEQLVETIKNLKAENDFVVVQIHWGVEYEHKFNQIQQNLAHQMIDAGADIIIGHHPHVVQGMEVYKGKPIFYSLGNFVFDQYFSTDTQEELAVGLHYEQGIYTMYLFPIKSTNTELSLMQNTEKENFLDKLISWSDLNDDLQRQIKQAKIIIE